MVRTAHTPVTGKAASRLRCGAETASTEECDGEGPGLRDGRRRADRPAQERLPGPDLLLLRAGLQARVRGRPQEEPRPHLQALDVAVAEPNGHTHPAGC